MTASLLVGGALASVVVGGATPASAQPSVTLYVAPSGAGDCTSQGNACGSIQTAINSAVAGTYNGDDVTISVGAGAYTENDTVDASSLDSLTIQGVGQSSTFVDGSQSGSVFTVSAGTVAFSDITIENGEATNDGNGGGINTCDGSTGCQLTVSDSTFTNDGAPGGGGNEGHGGAIDIGENGGQGTLTVTGSTFTNDNAYSNGGAVDSCDGSSGCVVTITDSTFTGDSAFYGGSAIYNAGWGFDNGNASGGGTLSVTNSTFTNNVASDGGGVIDNAEGAGNGSGPSDGTLTVTGSTFSNNTASHGGAIDNGDQGGTGSATVTNSTFSGNLATNDGGAIDNGDSSSNQGDVGGSVTVSDSTFSDNTASSSGGQSDGGAIDNTGTGTTAVTDSTFAGNTAGNDGGAIDNADQGGSGTTTVTSSTLWGNWAENQWGNDGTGTINNSSGTVDLAATILAAAPTGGECTGTVTDEGYNIDDDGSCGLMAAGSISNSSTLDDTLGALKQNAGPTQTMLPDSDSPAVGVIPNSTTLGLDTVCPTTDQQGMASAAGGSCNIGATQTAATAPTISAVTFSGAPAAPTVTVQGSGFGTEADLGTPVPAYDGYTGSDYGQLFYLLDGFGAGEGDGPYGDDVGLSISSYSNNQITFTFGSGYPSYGEANSGDSFSMTVLGTTFNGTVSYTTPTIDGVTFGGNPSNPTVTVTGAGLGTLADLGSPTNPGGGGTGSDYANNNLYFSDTTGSWQAGQSGNYVGLIISSYTNTQITFTFGNQYSVFGPVLDGDNYTMSLLGTTFNGTALVGTGYSCTISGDSTTTSFPVVMSESPAPPSSIDEGGTFSTALAAQVTVPASVIDHFIAAGATSLTVASQTSDEDGLTSVGGSSSGAVDPNTESATADNLPQSDTTLVADTPYTYDTAYNPVTWQTGPGTGKVYFVPGAIDGELTFVVHGTPTSESLSCAPPSGVAALGSTTVDPPSSSPSYQVPSPTPPLQNQVSAGTDGGWALTIANTSKTTVAGLSASVSVTDGAGPVTYDLTGMSASGTTCTGDGSGKVTCTVGSLASGNSDTLNLLVDTTGLIDGTTLIGSTTITSAVAGTKSSTLSAVKVVVVESGNGTEAVAAPGIPLASTKRTLKLAKAKVTLTLPKTKIKTTKKPDAGSDTANPITPLMAPFAAATVTENPPPVAVTLKSLAPSAEPALCPPTGTTKCEGNIIEAYGNFAVYTSNLSPIQAVVQFFYGSSIPKGTVYFLKPNGKTVDKLAVCKRTSAGYDTPCLASAEKDLGTTGNKYAQDTVYFTGNDPIMGRR
jgi:hypothetical protein